MDYFAACGSTSMCEAKCRAEYQAFDQQLALEAIVHSSDPVSKTIEKITESMLFVDLDEDAYTPMNIMAMVELSECRCVPYHVSVLFWDREISDPVHAQCFEKSPQTHLRRRERDHGIHGRHRERHEEAQPKEPRHVHCNSRPAVQ